MIARRPWGDLAVPIEPGATLPPADVLILGLPWDGSVCLRAGAAEAPAALRGVSDSSMAISERAEIVRREDLTVVDLGDIAPDDPKDHSEAARQRYLDRVERDTTKYLKAAARSGRDAFLLAVGGDHSVTIGLTRAFSSGRPEGYGLISIDAHPDLFDTYDGSPLSHACPMRRALDSTRLRPEHLLQFGLRSYNEVELAFMREQDIRYVSARELDRIGTAAAVALARERMQGVGGIYLSIDIDGADPSCAPGTGAPVAGGPSSRQVIDLVRGLTEALPVRAMDLVEIAPPIDPSGITLALALQIVFETFAVLAAKRRAAATARPR